MDFEEIHFVTVTGSEAEELVPGVGFDSEVRYALTYVLALAEGSVGVPEAHGAAVSSLD